MQPKIDRRGGAGASRTALALAWLAAAALLPASRAAAEAPLGIVLDQATLMKLPEKVSTIVVGNPAIADVAVQSGGLVVVTGKGYGTTNLIVLDRAGAVLMERQLVVRAASSGTIAVYRGAERETYSCTPDCERRITLGDSANYFGATMAQSDARNAQATTVGAAGKQGR
jgi:Flp pilus assembly secretin CpaC